MQTRPSARVMIYAVCVASVVFGIPAIVRLVAPHSTGDANAMEADSEMRRGAESPCVEGGCKKRIMLLTARRSGSSFVGSLFKEHPGITYLFEPLRSTTADGVTRTLSAATLSGYIQKLFSCNFTDALRDMKRLPDHQERLRWWVCKEFLLDCKECASKKKGVCVIDDVRRLETKCKQQTRCVAMKLIRIYSNHLSLVGDFLRDQGHVLHLVRDPRGVISSRITIDQSESASRRTPQRVYIHDNFAKLVVKAIQHCKRIRDALETTSSWMLANPSLQKVYHLYRYEDFAYHPEVTTRSLYSSLGMPLHDDVLRWLRKSTTRQAVMSKQYLYSTVRNSTATAEAWRHKLPFPFVMIMQSSADCQYVMRRLGYVDATSESMLLDSSLSLVQQPPVPL